MLKDLALSNLKEFIDLISDINGEAEFRPIAGSPEQIKETVSKLKKRYHYELNQTVINNNKIKINEAQNPTKMAWNIVNSQRATKTANFCIIRLKYVHIPK